VVEITVGEEDVAGVVVEEEEVDRNGWLEISTIPTLLVYLSKVCLVKL
jgi:hypothetical protein